MATTIPQIDALLTVRSEDEHLEFIGYRLPDHRRYGGHRKDQGSRPLPNLHPLPELCAVLGLIPYLNANRQDERQHAQLPDFQGISCLNAKPQAHEPQRKCDKAQNTLRPFNIVPPAPSQITVISPKNPDSPFQPLSAMPEKKDLTTSKIDYFWTSKKAPPREPFPAMFCGLSR